MDCPHITLKRKNVGNQHWHQCEICGQKFKVIEWDGKVTVRVSEEKELVVTTR